MEQTKVYASIVEEADEIAKQYVTTTESIERINKAGKTLLDDLERNQYIKVPFVGDFSAGKSSLLNSLMGISLLPTDVVPTTAVSYELYFSENEFLEIYHKGELKGKMPLSQILSLQVVAGDIVRVYVNNGFVKRMNDKGIVLVDMPGIDSGIAEHNNAILNYIQEGSFFFLVSPAEAGTLRSSIINFINELKKYGLRCAVIISKIDQKPESELLGIKETVAALASKIIDGEVKVGMASAADNNNDDVVSLLDSLEAEQFIVRKFSSMVSIYVNDIINELQLQIKLALSNKQDFATKIESIKEEQQRAIASLRDKNSDVQQLEDSVDDIMRDIREALDANVTKLANLLYNTPNDTKVFQSEVLSIIRPVLVNSFKREITEYQDVIGESVKAFSINVNDILNDSDNKMLQEVQSLLGSVGDAKLESMLKSGVDSLMKKLTDYKGFSVLLSTISKFLGPIVAIVIHFLPDIIKMIFGKGKESKIERIKQQLQSEVITKIVDNMREPVTKMLDEQRESAMREMELLIENETKKYDENIKAVQEEQQADEATTMEKVHTVQSGIEKLEQLLRA